MNIVAIDDDQLALTTLSWMLRQQGHRVAPHLDPVTAIHDIHPDVDLVISDVVMPGLDGFSVAELALRRVGNEPPRTLLISGYDHLAPLDRIPADQVIGLMDKPLVPAQISRVMRLLGETRRSCPGPWLGCCAQPPPDSAALCHGARYCRCPLYNQRAGPLLRSVVRDPALAQTLVTRLQPAPAATQTASPGVRPR